MTVLLAAAKRKRSRTMDWNIIWTGLAAGLVWVAAAINKVLAGGPPYTIAKILSEIFSFS